MSARIRAGAPVRLTAAVAVVGALLGGAAGAAAAAADGSPRARSVVIITLPATAWVDIRDGLPPNLSRLFATSSLADLATRTIQRSTQPGPGYLALGSGARSIAAPDAAAPNLQAAEPFDGVRAGAVFRTRTGRRIVRGVGGLGWPQLVVENTAASFDARPGALGQTLANAGIGRFVITNADERDAAGTVFHREAALSLMDHHGRVPGRVAGILRDDRTAPYGLRLDNDRVDAAFPDDFTTHRQVVLVDASDLARADAYRPLANPAQRDALHAQALARSDELVGRVLRHVDLARDAVVVVAPFHSGRARTLTVAAVRAPGVPAGFMESSTTRRAGFLQIVDVAPTVVALAGLERPDAMEGRAAEYHADSGSYRDRLDWLVQADRAAQFRDATIGKAMAMLVTITITLSALTALWYLVARRRAVGVFLEWASLTFLGYVVATFVVGAFPVEDWGTGAYFFLVVAIAIAFAALALGLGRAHPLDPLLIALGLIVVLHLGDLVSGAHLELSTVFGYSPTVGIRLAGIGNPGSAQCSAAALLFAVLVTERAPRRGRAIGLGVLVVTLVVIGAPIWGQDYGGALALGPTIVLWWLLQRGTRIHVRTIAIIAGVLVLTGLVAGLVDLSRPTDSRTHVGRFFEKVGNEGPAGFFTVIGRKLGLMIGTFSNTAVVLAVLSVLALVAYALLRTDVAARLVGRVPTLKPGLLCFAVLLLLATLLNDSGVQVTGMMLATLLPVLVYLAARYDDEPAHPERARLG